ncbi:MAG: hypothetical protein JOZ39_07220 [Chloroflexi bacterium]|nr:hypothetical protein [Chloroflexota bacterium]
MAVDVLGRTLNGQEEELMRLYDGAKALLAKSEIPPCVRRNVGVALAALWNATNDLGLQFEQLYDLGV